MKVASVEQIRQIEARVDASLMSYARMMRKAGEAASAQLRQLVDLRHETRVAFLIGKGNNGGDGLVMALELARQSPAQISLYLLQPRPASDELFAQARQAGLFIACASDDKDLRLLKTMVANADVIVDALFGIGLRLPLRGSAARVLRAVNLTLRRSAAVSALERKPSGAPFVFALDCPSGVDCDSGGADQRTLQADATIAFIAAKPGLFSFPAAKYVGELFVSTIGIPDSFPELAAIVACLLDDDAARAILPPRALDGHKGAFGKVMVVAGCASYIGALALSAEAAYRSGAGLVTIATTGQLTGIVASRLREPTFLQLPDSDGAINEAAVELIREQARGYDALLVGCGLGLHPATKAFVHKLLATQDLPPLVIDADALNILSEVENWWTSLPAMSIITPHAGEMARLTGSSQLSQSSPAEIQAQRWQLAAGSAADWQLVVTLKGAHTLIAEPSGKLSVNPFKTDALATAGTGDVLAGLIAGLRAQGASAYDAARLGAYVHALAGAIAIDKVGSSRSVIAGDVLQALGWAFHQIESG